MNKCIILTHGDFGRALLNTTEKIIGEQENIKVISNEHTSLKDLVGVLDNAVKEWQDDHVLIMVDFCGGSCWHAAQVAKRGRENVALISGVNLPVLLAYINRRESYRLPELADYLRESAVKGILVVCGLEPPSENHEPEDDA